MGLQDFTLILLYRVEFVVLMTYSLVLWARLLKIYCEEIVLSMRNKVSLNSGVNDIYS